MRAIPVAAVILILSSSYASFAKEQRLTYDDDASVYELVFDDGRISVPRMREAVWLSPYVTAAPAPFELAAKGLRQVRQAICPCRFPLG